MPLAVDGPAIQDRPDRQRLGQLEFAELFQQPDEIIQKLGVDRPALLRRVARLQADGHRQQVHPPRRAAVAPRLRGHGQVPHASGVGDPRFIAHGLARSAPGNSRTDRPRRHRHRPDPRAARSGATTTRAPGRSRGGLVDGPLLRDSSVAAFRNHRRSLPPDQSSRRRLEIDRTAFRDERGVLLAKQIVILQAETEKAGRLPRGTLLLGIIPAHAEGPHEGRPAAEVA